MSTTSGFPGKIPVIPYPGISPCLAFVTIKSCPVQRAYYMFTLVAYSWSELLAVSLMVMYLTLMPFLGLFTLNNCGQNSVVVHGSSFAEYLR